VGGCQAVAKYLYKDIIINMIYNYNCTDRGRLSRGNSGHRSYGYEFLGVLRLDLMPGADTPAEGLSASKGVLCVSRLAVNVCVRGSLTPFSARCAPSPLRKAEFWVLSKIAWFEQL